MIGRARTRRREILRALGGALLVPSLAGRARAQEARMRVLGILTPHQDHPGWPAFFQTLRQLGREDGRNLRIITRSAEGNLERLPRLAAELVAIRPDLIMAVNTPGARAATSATKEIPLLLADVGDPVGEKFVASLARPGGNVTAISNQTTEFTSKRLAIMKTLVPSARRIAILLHPDDPVTAPQKLDAERAAPSLSIEVRFFEARNAVQLAPAFERIAAWKADAALWLAGQTAPMMPKTVELAAAHRLPTMAIGRDAVVRGGLISYFIDQHDTFRRAAHYADKILKGAKPADLPVEQPTKFELVVNLKTAKALGLTIPASILVQADEVIE